MRTKMETRAEAIARATFARDAQWRAEGAVRALIEGTVHWSAWRRVGTAMGGRPSKENESSYRVGVWDINSPSGPKVIVGHRYPKQRDQWDVLDFEVWTRSLQGVGGLGEETLVLRELAEWARGYVAGVQERGVRDAANQTA